jgi:hypothetical protein
LFQEKYQILTNADGVNVFDASMENGKNTIEKYLLFGNNIRGKAMANYP